MTEYVTGLARALLASDALARGWGAGGLRPDLRAALEAGLRFPARATAPRVQAGDGPLPANAVALAPHRAALPKTGSGA